MNQAQLLAKRADHKTSHLLHLLLTVITAGMWIPVWFLVALRHQLTRDSIDRKLGKEE
jgi:cytochrome c biogenesis protein CcdA